jgi:hypothetical protein
VCVQGAELIDSVMDVVRKEAEGCDCLQGDSIYTMSGWLSDHNVHDVHSQMMAVTDT